MRGCHGIAGKLKAIIQGVDVAKAQKALSTGHTGRRLYPARTDNKDKKGGVHLDHGPQHTDDNIRYAVNIQAIANPEGKALSQFARKHQHKKLVVTYLTKTEPEFKDKLTNTTVKKSYLSERPGRPPVV
ncbi:MAG: hypothetical protein M1813_004172 [Trichoglossum hirsutum]|jgi:hypothetical protein|nr:MAG: hypothetical protein M1813_004172 [Trichoglossum hirsutum]